MRPKPRGLERQHAEQFCDESVVAVPDDEPWAMPLAWAERRQHREIASVLECEQSVQRRLLKGLTHVRPVQEHRGDGPWLEPAMLPSAHTMFAGRDAIRNMTREDDEHAQAPRRPPPMERTARAPHRARVRLLS